MNTTYNTHYIITSTQTRELIEEGNQWITRYNDKFEPDLVRWVQSSIADIINNEAPAPIEINLEKGKATMKDENITIVFTFTVNQFA